MIVGTAIEVLLVVILVDGVSDLTTKFVIAQVSVADGVAGDGNISTI